MKIAVTFRTSEENRAFEKEKLEDGTDTECDVDEHESRKSHVWSGTLWWWVRRVRTTTMAHADDD
jgi:hypothetical protein